MPDATKKYPTYKALAEAFRSGELPRTMYRLMLDNDECFLDRVDTQGMTPEEIDDVRDECRGLFHGDGQLDLEHVITALGIPCEGV